ncbi:MAG TPA: hypothetical protein VGK59_14935 [Ohtaekwangia sp.]
MKQLVFFLLLVSLISSCQKAKENAGTEESKAFTVERNTFFANLLAPAEAAARIQATAAEFNASLMNDPKIYAQYAGNEVKAAANMGIYLSDLNYSAAYSQKDHVKEYFTASYELSKAVGGERAMLEFVAKRYTENLENNDSARSVVTDLLIKSTRDLQGTEKEKLAGIAMAAYQIENLHLALGMLQSYPKDMLPEDARTVILVPLFKMVLTQQTNVENIYSYLKTLADPQNPDQNPNYPYYANAFEELIAVYKKLNVNEKIANNQGLELMNDAVVLELSQKVDAIRSKIVSAE